LKTCEACQRLVSDDGGFCPFDGKPLIPLEGAKVPSDPTDPRVGAAICGERYQIWRRVADGAMGRVYQALDKKEGRTVALKILHADVAEDEVSVERFKREFASSAALPHDYIVEVLDFEETEDRSFALVMEYLEGEELRTRIRREKVIRPEAVIRMFSQVAIGLTAAHERKVVHRDLKPDNVFLCGDRDGDRAKILDFGSVRDNSEGAKKLTAMGTTIGSPFYMSPEQAQALDALDHRADVWSLAAITFECVTGKVPFSGPTGPAILLSILNDDPSAPSEVGAAHKVPPTLDLVMEEALVKDANIRIPSVGALVDRVGQAYGLSGSHKEWASLTEAELAAQIERGLPVAIARHRDRLASVPDAGAVAADLRVSDPFKAGPDKGPIREAPLAGAPREPAPAKVAPTVFDDDIVMGVPKKTPKWMLAAIAGAAVIVGAVVVFLFAR
jgi:eukaryotic-like serine/threonine-protein kinase